MKLRINGIERDCKILPAPSKSFFIDHGTYGFPLYVIIAPAITEEEKSYGDILVCSLECYNSGYERLTPDYINTFLSLFDFIKLVEAYYEEGYCDIKKDGAEWLLENFQTHGVEIDKRIIEYVNNLDA